MNSKDKKLAIKLFDYFFKKANIISLELCFYKEYEWYIHVKTAIYYDLYLFTNNLVCDDNAIYKLKIFNNNKFLLPETPKELKINLIEHCIVHNVSLYIPFSVTKCITIIPKASSLEELAIKMELET